MDGVSLSKGQGAWFYHVLNGLNTFACGERLSWPEDYVSFRSNHSGREHGILQLDNCEQVVDDEDGPDGLLAIIFECILLAIGVGGWVGNRHASLDRGAAE